MHQLQLQLELEQVLVLVLAPLQLIQAQLAVPDQLALRPVHLQLAALVVQPLLVLLEQAQE